MTRPGGSEKAPPAPAPDGSAPAALPQAPGASSPQPTPPQRRGETGREARRRQPEPRSRRQPAASMALRPARDWVGGGGREPRRGLGGRSWSWRRRRPTGRWGRCGSGPPPASAGRGPPRSSGRALPPPPPRLGLSRRRASRGRREGNPASGGGRRRRPSGPPRPAPAQLPLPEGSLRPGFPRPRPLGRAPASGAGSRSPPGRPGRPRAVGSGSRGLPSVCAGCPRAWVASPWLRGVGGGV